MSEPEIVAINVRSDESVTTHNKWKIDIASHVEHVLEHTSIVSQDILEALVFTSFAFALDGRSLGSKMWMQKVFIVSCGLIATDLFAPAMAQAMRMSLALVFYSQANQPL